MPDHSTDLARPYPFASCPMVPRRLIGDPEMLRALDGPIQAELDRMAERVGLRPEKLTPGRLARLAPGIPVDFAEDALSENQVWGLKPSSVRKARLRAARKAKGEIFRRILAGSKGWRKRRLYVDAKGRPASVVSFLGQGWNSAEKIVEDFLHDYVRLTRWGLEIYTPVPGPWWFVSTWSMALEIHKSGQSVLRPRTDEEVLAMVRNNYPSEAEPGEPECAAEGR